MLFDCMYTKEYNKSPGVSRTPKKIINNRCSLYYSCIFFINIHSSLSTPDTTA